MEIRLKSGRWLILPLVLGLVAGPVETARGQDVANTSYVAPDGTRVLQQSIVVPAALEDVWHAFTTTDGIRSWAVPVADVDFRLGGIWESSYDRDAEIGDPANIRNRYLSYVPMRMISFQAVQAPPDFPHPEVLEDIFTVVEFEALGPERVRVTESMMGYRSGEAYDAVYRLFERGNAWTFRQLHRRFTEGPVDWSEQADGS